MVPFLAASSMGKRFSPGFHPSATALSHSFLNTPVFFLSDDYFYALVSHVE